jgi:thiamine-phosphate pyrophosphorylase
MKKKVDWSLYLVTDRELSRGRPIEEIVLKSVQGGVTVVQLREKECSTSEYIDLAIRIKKILSKTGVPLIINDRIDVALAVNADGVHVGQSDMPYDMARRIIGSDKIVGLTVETLEQARNAEQLDPDYLGVSAVFTTPTKTDTITEWGLEGISNLRDLSRHILIGIGGLNKSNAAEVIRHGADGIAVVSAICSADDPQSASRELRTVINAAKRKAEG